MPFISKDWRSPGEEWVKYDGGWERKSIIIDPNPNLNFGFDLIQPAAAASITTTAAIQIHNKANFNVEICEQQKPKTSVAEAVATLRPPLRRKNLSECENKPEQAINNVLDHRLMLKEHVRRIRGRLEHEQELDENQDPNQNPKTSSPQRANR